MARMKLTARIVESMTTPSGKRIQVFDTEQRGLCLRISEFGEKSFSVVYKHCGRMNEAPHSRQVSRSESREQSPSKLCRLRMAKNTGRLIWYLHEFVEVEVKTPVFLRGSFFRMNSKTQIISKSKRQLGKKQLKELGLRNVSCNVSSASG